MTRNRAAVLGHPIGHSLSPVLHRAAYRALGLGWRYDAIDVTEESLGPFIEALDDSWAGLSLTMPLKRAVLPYLDAISETAEMVGAANTVVLTDSGRAGHNTDVGGIVRAVRAATQRDEFRSVGIVGAGATAASAAAAAASWRPDDVMVCARRPAAARDLADGLPARRLPTRTVEWTDVAESLSAEIVVVTLPGDAAASLAECVPDAPGVLLDVTYHPWPTALAAAWQSRGGVVVPGDRMLLWQATAQVELMTGRAAPVGAMAEALDEALAARQEETPRP